MLKLDIQRQDVGTLFEFSGLAFCGASTHAVVLQSSKHVAWPREVFNISTFGLLLDIDFTESNLTQYSHLAHARTGIHPLHVLRTRCHFLLPYTALVGIISYRPDSASCNNSHQIFDMVPPFCNPEQSFSVFAIQGSQRNARAS